MNKYVTYDHPAVPPTGISVGVTYELVELQKRFSLEEIKAFFKADNFQWEELGTIEEVISKKK